MSIIKTAVHRPVAVCMFVLAAIMFGYVAFSRMPVTLLPELAYPTLTVRTDYTGSSPEQIEQLISKPIEQSLGVISGIRSLHSLSKANQSTVIIEFDWGRDMNFAAQEVRDRLGVTTLPKDSEKPVILRFNPRLDPIIRLGLVSSEVNEAALKQLRIVAEQGVKRSLETLPGVAAVQIGGGVEREIQVVFDQDKAAQRNISIEDIVARIEDENLQISTGKVRVGQQDYLVRAVSKLTQLDDLRNMVIAEANEQQVYLSDIAEVIDGVKPALNITRVNNQEAIEIAIYKEGEANTIAVSNQVLQRIEAIAKDLPPAYQLTVLQQQSKFITNAITEVQSAVWLGAVLASVVLYLFLGSLQHTVIIALAIPISILTAFNLMFAYDISLNIISLGGIALAVGLLVDNAIVVLESITRKAEQVSNLKSAAIEGCSEVASAIVASTLTSIAVFLPLAFVVGIAGQLFYQQAMTISFSLVCSLVVALTVIPMMVAHFRHQTRIDEHKQSFSYQHEQKRRRIFSIVRSFPMLLLMGFYLIRKYLARLAQYSLVPLYQLFQLWLTKLTGGYQRCLVICLQRKQGVLVLATIFGCIASSVLPKLGGELLPPLAQDHFTLQITLPKGTPLSVTDSKLQTLATFIERDDRVLQTYSLAGASSLMQNANSQEGEHSGALLVKLKASRELESVQQKLQQRAANIPGARVTVKHSELFTQDRGFQLLLYGHDLTELSFYSEQVKTLLSQQAQFDDITSSLTLGQPELNVTFNPGQLAQLELNAKQVSDRVMNKISGQAAGRMKQGEQQLDIVVKAEERLRTSLQGVAAIKINPEQPYPVTLSSVASITQKLGPNEVQRIDQSRVSIITASLTFGDLVAATETAESLVAKLNLPRHIRAEISGQSQDMFLSFQSLLLALMLAVFLVYVVMASQFESLLNPIIILVSVPLALLGAALGLYFTSTHLSILAFIGSILLTGIVVNNGIVLVDKINRLRGTGLLVEAAILRASESRFRPILMTSTTTILTMLPLILSGGEGAELRAPLAITLCFGLSLATLLTLIVVPVLYALLNRDSGEARSA